MNDDGFWSRPPWPGGNYQQALRAFHAALKPERYLEIGVDKGATLAIADCASIGVDPDFSLDRPAVGKKPCCMFFQRTSDEFFRDFDPVALLGGPLDLAFLDGLHAYETLLRDFRNTERFCRPGSVILMHDCMPADAHVARRRQQDWRYRDQAPNPDHWAGDVWKTAYVLLGSRPDLKIVALDAEPTGLIAISRLSPFRVAADEIYAAALDEVEQLDLQTHADDYYAKLDVRRFPPGGAAIDVVAELAA